MSVIMTFRVKADPKKLEEQAASDPGTMRGIADAAVKAGLIAHRFYGTDDGQVMVVDEWPDQETFQRFFEANRAQIEPMMAAAGVTGEPELSFWHKLETHDEVGWDS